MTKSLLLGVVTVLALVGCSASPDAAPAVEDQSEALGTLTVNGHTLNAHEQKWMRHIASDVVPHLAGTREERLVVASRAAWWSLKEGDFDTRLPPEYSNCNATTGDRIIGPLETCAPHRAWQVGLAGVQVPGHSVAELEALAHKLFPDKSIASVLEDAADEAGFAPGSATSQAIVASEGSLRASWLLRRSAIGFTVVAASEVVPECIDGNKGWCYGTRWDTTNLYAPTKVAALRSIANIRTILAGLAP